MSVRHEFYMQHPFVWGGFFCIYMRVRWRCQFVNSQHTNQPFYVCVSVWLWVEFGWIFSCVNIIYTTFLLLLFFSPFFSVFLFPFSFSLHWIWVSEWRDGHGAGGLIFYSFYLVCGRGSVGAHKLVVARWEVKKTRRSVRVGEELGGKKESGLLRGAHGSCCVFGFGWDLGDVFSLWRGGGPT